MNHHNNLKTIRQSASTISAKGSLAMIKRIVPWLLLLLAIPTRGQNQQIRVGEVEYFGAKGVDLEKVKASLPIHEGEELSFDALSDSISQVKASIKKSTAEEPTDVGPVCCDLHGNWIIYIGLRGQNLHTFHNTLPPQGSIRFPQEVKALYDQTMNLLFDSIRAGATEDRSRGYALSTYPPLRAKQLAMREYATHNATFIRRILNESSDAKQRTIAAQLLGYANHDRLEIASLVKASHDSEEGVRNNAIRALGVLAESRPTIANEIPGRGFVEMLNSGIWSDRNKAAYLLSVLTISRKPRLLQLLRRRASESLLEMARWRERGHAQSSQLILGRIAGIEEHRLQELVGSNNIDPIIEAFSRSQR
jgi:hypothetical protein